jgi:ketosteroid isomerase-like protein
MWTRNDPVTLFGAVSTGAGSAEIERSVDALAARFSNCTAYNVEVIAAGASGDPAYLVAIEHITASVAGGEPQPYQLPVTTIFRREDGEWKIVHRHGDSVPESASARLQAQRMSDDLKTERLWRRRRIGTAGRT